MQPPRSHEFKWDTAHSKFLIRRYKSETNKTLGIYTRMLDTWNSYPSEIGILLLRSIKAEIGKLRKDMNPRPQVESATAFKIADDMDKYAAELKSFVESAEQEEASITRIDESDASDTEEDSFFSLQPTISVDHEALGT